MFEQVFLFFFGAISLMFSVHLYKTRKRTSIWPKVHAMVKQKSVRLSDTSVSFGRANYVVDIAYTYKVGSQEFTGDRLYPGSTKRGWLKPNAEKFVKNLPDTIEITYNPEDPQESFVYTFSSIWFWGTLCTGLFFIVFAFFI